LGVVLPGALPVVVVESQRAADEEAPPVAAAPAPGKVGLDYAATSAAELRTHAGAGDAEAQCRLGVD